MLPSLLSLAAASNGSDDSQLSVGATCVGSDETIHDEFKSADNRTWSFADRKYVSQFAPCYYLANHSLTNASLSQGEGRGLKLRMSHQPCNESTALCHGAAMASGHVSTLRLHSYGDYETRLRAPHNDVGDDSKCNEGIYGYFTAGYVDSECGTWNEINFGFHPDRDEGGHKVSLELHADSGGYHESTSADLGFNYRNAFHTYRIKHRPCDVSWWIDGRIQHVLKACLTKPMHTSFILRTNDKGAMPSTTMEFAYFKFKPYKATQLRPPANVSVTEHIAWHEAHPDF